MMQMIEMIVVMMRVSADVFTVGGGRRNPHRKRGKGGGGREGGREEEGLPG